MSLVTTGKLVEEAHINGKCVPAFNVGSMEMVRGAVKAAEELNVPIIIQIAERLLKYLPMAHLQKENWGWLAVLRTD